LALAAPGDVVGGFEFLQIGLYGHTIGVRPDAAKS
jgi:hypothetical protein